MDPNSTSPPNPNAPPPDPTVPTYAPAPHLVANSFLSTDDLIFYFKDFSDSLKHITYAPELVFERLVSNLGASVAAKTALEKQAAEKTSYRRNTEEVEKLKAEVAALKESMRAQASLLSACLTIAQNNYPELSTAISEWEEVTHGAHCSSGEEEKGLVPALGAPPSTSIEGLKVEVSSSSNPTIISYCVPETQSTGPEWSFSKEFIFGTIFNGQAGLPIGLTSLYTSQKTGLDVGSCVCFRNPGVCEVSIFTPGGNLFAGSGCSWLVVDPCDFDFQCGNATASISCSGVFKTKQIVKFIHKYSEPPQVVVWLRTFHLRSDKGSKLHVTAVDITTEGFMFQTEGLIFPTSSMPVLRDEFVTVSWVAHATAKAGVSSGSIEVSHRSRGTTSAFEKFSSSFSTAPHVITAINRIEMDVLKDVRFSIKTSEVTTEGMLWELEGLSDKTSYCIGASYIALE